MQLKVFQRWRAFLRKFFNPHQIRGRKGERAAVRYLKKRGFKILERNWHSNRYEIDIIAQYASCTVFVEVRGRQISSLQSGYDSVGKQKKRAIAQGIRSYLRQHKGVFSYRFDILSVQWDTHGKLVGMQHYENVPLGH